MKLERGLKMLESVFVNSVEKRDRVVNELKKQKRYAGFDKVVGFVYDDIPETDGYIVWYRVRRGF